MINKPTLHSRLLPSDELLVAELDEGESAVLSLKDCVYYGLNAVATRIWHLLEERKKVTEIRELLLEEFSVDPDRLTGDLLELIEQLGELGLVEILSETAP